MAKLHLVQSQTPLTEGRDQDAMCGDTIEKAVFGAFIDTENFGDPRDFRFSNISVCMKCLATKWNPDDRYIYLVKKGEDEHQSDSSLSD